MNISEHDKKILDEMRERFKELTGKEATHVFIDTTETIEMDIEECDHCYQEATHEYFGNKCCDDCYDEFLEENGLN